MEMQPVQQDDARHILYKTHGTCSQYIDVTLDDSGRIAQCHFMGGCAGNTTGISQLVRGMKVQDVLDRLDGIRCGTKPTSCPDQLCRALEELQKRQET